MNAIGCILNRSFIKEHKYMIVYSIECTAHRYSITLVCTLQILRFFRNVRKQNIKGRWQRHDSDFTFHCVACSSNTVDACRTRTRAPHPSVQDATVCIFGMQSPSRLRHLDKYFREGHAFPMTSQKLTSRASRVTKVTIASKITNTTSM